MMIPNPLIIALLVVRPGLVAIVLAAGVPLFIFVPVPW